MKPLPATHFIEIGELRLPIIIKKHRTSRRLTVRYQPLNQSLSLTIPQRVSIKQGLDFINERHEWIRRQVDNYATAISFCDGQVIPVLGKNMRLKHVGGRGNVSEGEDILNVHGAEEFMARRVERWLTQKAKSEISELVAIYSRMLNVKPGNITLRDTTSRWGSCSTGGNLSFSWRLIFAPYEVLAYVVAHEVAHIMEHNHSPAFWKLLEQVFPELEEAQAWLKKNGKTLYMYGG